MNCPNCGAENQPGASWCGQCWKPLAATGPGGFQQAGAPGQPEGGSSGYAASVPAYPSGERKDFAYDVAEKKSIYDADGRMIGAPAGKPVAPKKSKTGLYVGLGTLLVVVVVVLVVVLS